MRQIGFVLIVLGALQIVSQLILPASLPPTPGVERDLAIERQYNGGFLGVCVIATGVMLLVLNRQPEPVQAVAVEQWISIPLTAEAIRFVRSEMQERRYPPGSGLRIVAGEESGTLALKFDLASDDVHDCVGESHGIAVFVHKSLVSRLKNNCIDFIDGSLAVVPVIAAS
jgi:Fe-S cluster assembly iron-binding protein IscA